MKLSDYVLQRVAQTGVRHVFLVPGGGAMHLDDSLAGREDLEFVANYHEHGCAVGAEAYGKTTGNLGVALITTGPGGTNCVTGVASAWVNSTPTLFISGQVKRADYKGDRPIRQLGLQEIDIVSIVRPITKYAVTVTEPASIRGHLDRALHLARSGRPGPVWIDIPLDVQSSQIDPDTLEGWTPPSDEGARVSGGLDASLDTILSWLTAAERPVIFAGGGVRFAGALDRFLVAIERLGVPVLTSWVGTDLLPDDHPLFVGRPGQFASRAANFAIQNADFMLSIGARWDNGTTAFGPDRFGRSAKRVFVDVDPHEVDKLSAWIDHGVVAGADVFLDALLDRVPTALPRRDAWLERCREWRRRYPVVTQEFRGRASLTSTYVLFDTLAKLSAPDDVLVQGSAGVHSEIFFMSYPVKGQQRVIADGSYGAMGYGVPAALGACLAAGRRTVLIDGDGSFLPNVQELGVAARLNLPLKIIVVNNGGYSSIRVAQQRWFGRMIAADASSGLTLPEPAALAAAFGIPSVRIDAEPELESKLAAALAAPGPVVIDVRVPPEEDRVPRVANYQKADGTMATKPLEDMFPLLDREEFLANMIVPPLED